MAERPDIHGHGGPVHQRARGGDVLLHVGEHPLQALVLDDRLAELLARFGIVERRFEPRLRDTDGERRDADATLVEHAHHDVEAAIESPSNASSRSATSSKCSAPTGEARCPIFFSFLPRETP